MKTSMNSKEVRPLKSNNNDGKMNCLWMIMPTRLHPFVCLKYTLDFDIYVNVAFALYGIGLAYWQTKDGDNYKTFNAWWGVYGNTGMFGIFFCICHLSCWITALIMDKYTLYYLKVTKNLVCRIIHYIMARQVVLGMHLLMLVIQLGGYINDWYEAHDNQKKLEKIKDPNGERILSESKYALGTTVRVEGSYYNEMTALNFALFWVALQLMFICYWMALGHTMSCAAHRVVQDNEKSIKLTIPRKDPLKKQLFMVSYKEAKTMIGENDEELG